MFEIGKFSNVGRVSTRSLRYYDRLGCRRWSRRTSARFRRSSWPTWLSTPARELLQDANRGYWKASPPRPGRGLQTERGGL